MKRFQINGIISICFLFFILAACNKSGNAGYNNTAAPNNNPTGIAPNAIVINGMSYTPATLTVAKGSLVKWTNQDANTHTVTSNDGTSFDSGNMPGNGGTFSYQANTAGTYAYHCTIHGLRMAGTLVVNP